MNKNHITPERMEQLLDRSLGWIKEMKSGADLYDTLKNEIGMTNEEITAAGFDLKEHYNFDDVEPIEVPPVYLIWADGHSESPLVGQSGFLTKNRKVLTFPTKKDAEIFVKDLRSLCLNNSPSTHFVCIENPGKYASDRRMALETIKELDMTPSFDPNNFEIKNRIYDNTGGGCMVATVEFYLPDLDKSIWINSNDESVNIASADYVWNEDNSDTWERWENVMLYNAGYGQELPDDIEPWIPMIQKTLEYNIEQETAHYRNGYTFDIPVVWLPDSIRQHVEPEYLEWLQDNEKEIKITKSGQIVEDDDYIQSDQSQSGGIKMEGM